VPVVRRQPEQDEASPWGRSGTSWFVVLGVLGVVVVNLVVSAVAAAGTLALLLVAAGLLRLLLPRPAGLTVRSRAFDTALMLGLGSAIAVLAAIVPQ